MGKMLMSLMFSVAIVQSGGKICLTIHFAPLWQKNVPRFGIAHALALGVSWLHFNAFLHAQSKLNANCAHLL